MATNDIIFTDFNADFEKTNRNDLALFKNINSIKESIKNIVLTKKGSCLMTPKFGCGVWNYMFNMLDVLSIDNIKDIIRTNILNYEPRITVKNIDIKQENDNALFLTITYTINSFNVNDTVYVTVSE